MSKLSKVRWGVGEELNADLDPYVDNRMVVSCFIVMDNMYIDCKFYPYQSVYYPNIVPLVKSVTEYYHTNGKPNIMRVNQALLILDDYISLKEYELDVIELD